MMPTRLRARRVRQASDLAALAPAWAEIAAQSGQGSPFLSHDWFACCWKAVPPGRRPELVVVEDGRSPVAIVPLAHRTEQSRGLPVRTLAFLDSPDTPFVDIPHVGGPEPVIEALLDHLGSRSDWDVLRLQKLPVASSTLKALEEMLSGRFSWRRAGTVSSPYLAIEGSWTGFYAAKSQRFKKTARNIQNRLERAGQVSIEEHRAVDPASALFREALEITRRSWKAERGVAIATMERMPEFFRELTRRAADHGWLSLWLLRLDGRAVAMEYQLRAAGKVHALRADYDAEFRDLSPGSALNFAIVRALFERGDAHEYDMGPGLNEYKLRWASGSHDCVSLKVYRGSLYARFLHGLEETVIPAARKLKDRLTSGLPRGGESR
jgi:CelD/BcsL family acetyltransferase involved in cellulose biosynthesis